MYRIVRPGRSAQRVSMEMFKTVAVKERMVDEDTPAEPIGSPSPTAPSPSAPPAEVETNIDAGEKPETNLYARIK